MSENLSFEKNTSEYFLEKLGFFSVARLPIRSKNEIYIGQTKEGCKCFIKKYVIRSGRETGDTRRPKIEISCYENLTNLNLPKVISYDYDKKYLAVEYIELEDIELSMESINELVDFYEQRVLTQDGSFLYELSFYYYENNLFPRLREAKESGLILFAEEIIKKIEGIKDKIESVPKYFSHHDFILSNIKKSSKGIMLIDFEFACNDNAMYDLATFYIELENKEDIREYFLNKIRKLDTFDQELFNIMCIRRAAEIVCALKNNQASDYFKRNMNFLNSRDLRS